MEKKGNHLLRIIVYLTVALLLLAYGFSIGRYEVFPFELLKSVKQSDEERLQEADNFIYSAMQRLHVSKLYLPEDQASGGAMTAAGTDVLIVNRIGELIAFDFDNFKKFEVNVPQIYLGLDLLEENGWLGRDDFDPTKVRVKGAYAEKKGINEIELYVSYNFYNGDCFRSNLSHITLKKTQNVINAQGEWQNTYSSTPCLYPDKDLTKKDTDFNRWIFGGHVSGGRIIRYDDQHLLLSEGDYFYDGYDKEAYAMDEDKSYGKFILINTHTNEQRIFAKGTRNAQGLYKDKEGVIWSTEHGPAGGDELNVIRDGQNYGWPEVTHGLHYSYEAWPMNDHQGRHDQYTRPIYAWVGSIAPSDLVKIEGDKFGVWQGDLIVTSLRDKSIHRLRPGANNTRIVYDETIDIGHRIRNIIVLHDESLLLRTDDNYLIHIDDAGPVFKDFNRDTFFLNNEIARRFQEFDGKDQNTGSKDKGALVFERSCSLCHSVEGRSMIGPNLNNLANRRVGSLEEFNYSNTLNQSKDVWNEELLQQYISSPQNIFPGTSMEQVKLSEEEIELVTKFLLEN